MNLVNSISGSVLMALAAGSAMASGPVEVISGDLLVNLGNAASNSKSRTLVLNPGDYSDEISYVLIDESGVETLGTVWGFTGDVNIQSNIGKDTIQLLGLQVDNLTINTGRGRDTVYLNLVEVSGALDVRTGGGRDNVMLINQVVEGNAAIWSQGGVDNVSIASSFFEGSVAVRTGNGSDHLTVSYSGFDGARPLFNGQGGNDDTFTDGGNNGFWAGDPRIIRFENIEEPEVEEPETVVYEIGDIGPGGGTVFQINDSGTNGLEFAPEILGGTPTWGCAIDLDSQLSLNGIDNVATGEESSAVLFSAVNSGLCQSSAAQAVIDYSTTSPVTGTTVSDWYLPSTLELLEIRDLAGLSSSVWSSTEETSGNAWVVQPINAPTNVDKLGNGFVNSVLPVRGF